MPTPTFSFCGRFTGKTSASRWLKAFDREVAPLREADQLPPQTYLEYLDLLLLEDAAEWAESNSEAIRLLNSENPTQATVDQFTSLFKQRFPAKIVDVAPLTFDAELADLRQQPNETITSYYTRTLSLMQKYGARDRSTTVMLSLAEGSLLDTFLRTWIRGLTDVTIKRKCAEGMGVPDRSLRMLYDVAEATRRVNAEIQKLFEEETKENELQFYKEIAQRNMPKTQIDALRASYQTARSPPRHQPWSIHTDPPQRVPEAPTRPQHYQTQSQPQTYRQSSYQQYESLPPVLAQNLNRANAGRNANPSTNAGSKSKPLQQASQKDLPDRTTSKNPWINGTFYWSYGKDGLLCVKCGTKGHSATKCETLPLPAWEQSYLRMIVFGDNPQANFASAGFGEYDGAVRPYGTGPKPSSVPSSSGQATPSSSSVDSYISPRANSVQFGVAGLSLHHPHSADAKASQAEAFLGEGSGPNKRAHVEEPVQPGPSQPRRHQLSQRQQGKLPEQNPQPAPAIPQHQQPPASVPVPQLPQALPQPMDQAPDIQVQQPFQFQSAPEAVSEERPKRKGKKRVGKKAEPQPLAGMFNGTQYDSPVSIREVLQNTKVDMSWMDLVAWSPAVCKELKRLCTRVPKKRMPKASGPQPPAPQPVPQQGSFPQFNFQPMQQFPQPVPAHMMPTQTFQPMMSGGLQDPQAGPNLAPASQSQQSSQQTLGNTGQSASIASCNVDAAAAIQAEKHTRFLGSLVGVDKAFRIPSTMKKPDGSEVQVEKGKTQADQGSDMNVISLGMVRFLDLAVHLLSEIGFKGLSMRTADHRDTVLEYWVWLRIGVEGIWRDIRCFVAPEVVSVTESGRSEYLSLILGIPWLYSVDASISIRLSTIFIGDRTIGEQVRGVIGPELVFCKDHNLLMYPKSVMSIPKVASKLMAKATIEEVEDSSDSSEGSSDSGDDLSDVEEITRDFQ